MTPRDTMTLSTPQSPVPRTAKKPRERSCPHLAGVVSLRRTGLGAAVTPACLLQDVGGLLPGLPRHDEVNLLLAGLRGGGTA